MFDIYKLMEAVEYYKNGFDVIFDNPLDEASFEVDMKKKRNDNPKNRKNKRPILYIRDVISGGHAGKEGAGHDISIKFRPTENFEGVAPGYKLTTKDIKEGIEVLIKRTQYDKNGRGEQDRNIFYGLGTKLNGDTVKYIQNFVFDNQALIIAYFLAKGDTKTQNKLQAMISTNNRNGKYFSGRRTPMTTEEINKEVSKYVQI